MGRTERLAEPKDFGKYQLIARLAHGRMGDVYKAKSHGVEGFEKILAIKVLDPALAGISDFVETVIEEAKRAVALSHANVAQVYDLGQTEDTDQFYIATEFVNGFDLRRAMDLADRCDRDWGEAISIYIAAEIAKGLDYAHRRKDFNFNNLNIVHRDLAPPNVMISHEGEVKITDFGISRALEVVPDIDEEDTLRRYRFAAPEVVDGGEHTRQSDIFCLGLIIYEMLAGKHPYGDDEATIEQKAASGAVPPIGEYASVPRQLQQILESMLVPDPAGRIGSAGQVYEELTSYLFGNNLDADARTLGHLVEALRRDEQRLSPEDTTQEVGLEEISVTELTSVLSRSSLDGEVGALESSPTGVSSATQSDLPSAKIQELISEKKADQEAPPLPEALKELFRSARAGAGKAVLVSGQFGSGREYLSDRLVDALGWQGNTRAFGIQTTGDDVHRPFGVLSDLMMRCLHQTVADTDDHREAALEALAGFEGVGQEAVDSLAALWDMRQMPRIGYEERRDHLTELFMALLTEFAREGPLVLVIDRVERVDRLTLDVLRKVVADIGELSVLLIMVTRGAELMRAAFDAGQPEDLEAIRVVGQEPPEVSALTDLPDTSSHILLLLALSGQPMSQAELSQLLALPGDELLAALRGLADRGAVRVPRTGIFLVGLIEPGIWVEETFDRSDVEKAARGLARYYKHRVVRGQVDRLTPTLVRLHAIAGDRRRMLRLADAYSDWLEREGWLDTALDFDGHVAELLAKHPIGSPQARISYILSRAELALELSRLDQARQSLEPIAALTDTMRNEHQLVRGQLLFGRMAMQEDDVVEARTYFERAADIARGLNAPELLARSLLALAGWAERYGDPTASKRYLEGAMNLYHRWGTHRMDLRSRALMLQHAVLMWAERGMLRRAERLQSDLDRLAEVCSLAPVECRAQWARARLARARDEYDKALSLLEDGEANAHRYGLTALRIALMREQIETALEAGYYDQTLELASTLIELAGRHEDLYSQQRGHDIGATAQCLAGRDPEDGLRHLQTSLARAKVRNIPRDIYLMHRYLEDVFEVLGRQSEADEHRREAERMARRMRYQSAA